jgi:immune inhibitor A
VAGGRYSYGDLNLHLPPSSRLSGPEGPRSATTLQYAGYYVELSPLTSPSTLQFAGATQAALVGNAAHSGSYQWWGNRGDLIDATLTRTFDLTQVTFWTWYDLENGWDYAYVSASTDSGQTWQSLPTLYTTIANPVGNNLGYGYTGLSGGGKRAQWVNDQANLTPFAGKQILLRFEYVTDDAVTGSGFCVDDVAIAEIGFADDAEGDTGWDAQGFVRTANSIDQHWQLRLITFGSETTVVTVPVDAFGQAQATLPAGRRLVLAVAATAPVTTEPAVFTYTLSAGVLAGNQPPPAGVAIAR